MNGILTLDNMRNMNIDEIVNLYRNGYTIDENININNLDPKIVSAQGITISTGALLLIGAGVLAYILIIRR